MFAGGIYKNGIGAIEPGPAVDVKTFCIRIFEPPGIAVHGIYFLAVDLGVQQVDHIQVFVGNGYDMNRTGKLEVVLLWPEKYVCGKANHPVGFFQVIVPDERS